MRNRSHRQEVKTITEYITANTTMPPFFPYPRFLLKMDLSQTAKLLYALLLDRSTLSQKNGWQDNEGRTYIVYPIAEIAEILDKSTMTIQNSLKELDIAGLLERERRGFSAPNRLYVKVPEVVKVSLGCSPTALESKTAATEESTPPDNAQRTLPFPTLSRICRTDSSTNESIRQSPAHPHTSSTKFESIFVPSSVCSTSGWN